MAEFESASFARAVLVVLAGSCLLACSGAPEPEPVPPAVPPTLAPPAPPQRAAPQPKPRPPLVVEIDPAPPASKPKTLAEAARDERARRKTAGRPVAVIDNKNLAEYAATGELTYVEEEEGTAGAEGLPEVGEDGLTGAERYWRDEALKLRLEWQQTAEDIEDHESRVAELRRRFYAEDDPFVRDGQIKPEWDLTLERLTEAKAALEAFPSRLDNLYDEALAAGAEPEWLEEGSELEPERRVPPPEDPLADDDYPQHEVEDPPVASFDDEDPP